MVHNARQAQSSHKGGSINQAERRPCNRVKSSRLSSYNFRIAGGSQGDSGCYFGRSALQRFQFALRVLGFKLFQAPAQCLEEKLRRRPCNILKSLRLSSYHFRTAGGSRGDSGDDLGRSALQRSQCALRALGFKVFQAPAQGLEEKLRRRPYSRVKSLRLSS